MKIATLSGEQNTKLLEMCKKFFPEYKTIRTDLRGEWAGIVSFIKEEVVFITEDLEQTLIHWHHLCTTELPKRMDKKLRRDDKLFGSGDFFFHCLEHEHFHIVDYLYDYWKNKL